jgi:hypothetical protein
MVALMAKLTHEIEALLLRQLRIASVCILEQCILEVAEETFEQFENPLRHCDVTAMYDRRARFLVTRHTTSPEGNLVEV